MVQLYIVARGLGTSALSGFGLTPGDNSSRRGATLEALQWKPEYVSGYAPMVLVAFPKGSARLLGRMLDIDGLPWKNRCNQMKPFFSRPGAATRPRRALQWCPVPNGLSNTSKETHGC